jgi:hypothetical protein
MSYKDLEKIGEGRLRTVYAIDDIKVYKVAKIKEGREHNMSEYDIFFNTKNTLLPTCYLQEDNFNSICVQRADKITEDAFQDITGIPFKEFSFYINALQQNMIKSIKDPELKKGTSVEINKFKHALEIKRVEEKYSNSIFLCKLKSLLILYGQNLRDFKRISSYGVTKQNELKIIDYGIYKKPFFRYINEY